MKNPFIFCDESDNDSCSGALFNPVLSLILGWFFAGKKTIKGGIGNWYRYFEQPVFSPPNRIFAPVWTTFYLLMAVALCLVWRKGISEPKGRRTFRFFIIHLFFNAIWSVLFFSLRNPFSL